MKKSQKGSDCITEKEKREKKSEQKKFKFFLRMTGCVNVKEYNGEGRRKMGERIRRVAYSMEESKCITHTNFTENYTIYTIFCQGNMREI